MSSCDGRPLVCCEACGRHVRRGAAACPFCGGGSAGRFAKAAVVAAFFGAAAIPGCAYGPGPDDFVDADGSTSEVSSDSADGQAQAPDSDVPSSE